MDMPKGANRLDDIRSEGRKLLATLEAEIREREAELAGLQANAAKWLAALNLGASPRRGPGRPKGSATTTRRPSAAKPKRTSPSVDWDAILAKLPKSFTKEDLEKATPTLKAHAQVRNVALARWSRAGSIKKSAPGKYARVGKSTA
jgi:hypothetical protein